MLWGCDYHISGHKYENNINCKSHSFLSFFFKFDAGFSGRLGTLYLKQVLKVITMIIICQIQCIYFCPRSVTPGLSICVSDKFLPWNVIKLHLSLTFRVMSMIDFLIVLNIKRSCLEINWKCGWFEESMF